MAVQIGSLISFTYSGISAHDKFPQILVLHNGWQGFVHGLNFNYLTEQEKNYIKAILNEEFAKKLSEKDPVLKNKLNQFAGTYDSLNITSPHDFYTRFVRQFIKPKNYDPYRRYSPSKMTGIKVISKKEILTGEQKDTVFNKFVNKFQNMRGPRFR